jgi:hypothetical protein
MSVEESWVSERGIGKKGRMKHTFERRHDVLNALVVELENR